MTTEEAVKLAETGWWTKVSAEEAAMFQLFERHLCMPFADFHAGVEKLLGRGVWSHEFAFADQPGGLREQALGKAVAPTFDQILGLIPEHLRVIVASTEHG